jgi:hypothetical protein
LVFVLGLGWVLKVPLSHGTDRGPCNEDLEATLGPEIPWDAWSMSRDIATPELSSDVPGPVAPDSYATDSSNTPSLG